MAYTTPTTRTTGELIDASDWNTDLVENIKFLANPPACRAYNSANQSIAHNSTVYVTFNSETFDTDSMHSTSSNTGRITINTAGLYEVKFQAALESAADYALVQLGLRLNGSTVIGIQNIRPAAGGEPWVTVSTHYIFAATDYVEASVLQTNGASAARNLLRQSDYSPIFSAGRIGSGNAP